MRNNKSQPAYKNYFLGKVIRILEQPFRLLGLEMHKPQRVITISTVKKD